MAIENWCVRVLPRAGLAGVFLAGSALTGAGMQAEAQRFEVPRMTGIAIDGDDADWQGGGLRVEMVKPIGLDAVAVGDHTASFRLGWDAEGLLVIAVVRDNVWLEDAGNPRSVGATRP